MLSDVDPNLTLLGIQSMQEQVDSNFDQRRAVARMTGLFGILALMLAAVGTLWRDGVHGGAADERDRRAHGAGGESDERDPAGAARGVSADPDWVADRHSGFDRHARG